jgi:hypothetical protein
MCIEIRSLLTQCPHHIVTTMVYCAFSWQFTNIACAPAARQTVVSDDRTEGWCHACSQTAMLTGRNDGFEPFDLSDLAGVDVLMGLGAGLEGEMMHELDSGPGAGAGAEDLGASVGSGSSSSVTIGSSGGEDVEEEDMLDAEADDSP